MDHRGEDNGRWEDAIQMHCGFSSPNQRLQKQFWLNLNVSIIRVDWSLDFTGCKLWNHMLIRLLKKGENPLKK